MVQLLAVGEAWRSRWAVWQLSADAAEMSVATPSRVVQASPCPAPMKVTQDTLQAHHARVCQARNDPDNGLWLAQTLSGPTLIAC